MPFAVWCTTCKPHETIIGQGVRFNAEKKKVGNYYSTPIYSFRMKHTTCGGWIEIRTDPQNTAYVVVEGGRKRDTGEDRIPQPGEIAIRPHGLGQDPAEKDPFAKIEGKVEDRRRANAETSRILELQERQDRDWADPYAQSKRLRRTFRAERKGLEKLDANREALKDKMSLGIDVVDETEEDRRRAEMVDFGDDQTTVNASAARATRIRPMFEHKASAILSDPTKRGKQRKRTVDRITQKKEFLQNELTGNTRAVVDPFLNDIGDDLHVWKPGVKKKRLSHTATSAQFDSSEPLDRLEVADAQADALDSGKQHGTATVPASGRLLPTLVSYPSDSE